MSCIPLAQLVGCNRLGKVYFIVDNSKNQELKKFYPFYEVVYSKIHHPPQPTKLLL